MKAVEALRITINEEQPESNGQPITVGALISHFKQHELGPIEKDEEEEGRSYSTRITYIDILDTIRSSKMGRRRTAEGANDTSREVAAQAEANRKEQGEAGAGKQGEGSVRS